MEPATKDSHDQLANQSEKPRPQLSFDFQIIEQKLLIKTHFEKTDYVCPRDHDPYMSFDMIKNLLYKGNYKVGYINKDELTLLIGGFYPLQFKSQQIVTFKHFRVEIQRLRQELDGQKAKNNELSSVIKSQQTEIKTLAQRLTQLQQVKVNSLSTNLNLLSQRLNQLEQANSTFITTNFSELTQRFSQVEQTHINSQERLRIVEAVNNVQSSVYQLEQIAQNSQVITTSEQIQTIQSFFGDKRILCMQRLYQARENSFSTQVFHEKCDNIPHTLVVCVTEFGRKIGGYNPLAWSSSGQYKSTRDSFIFSLTNQHKFIPVHSANTIYDHPSFGPFFGDGTGGYDLMITDRAQTQQCSSSINRKYFNNNYTANNPVSLHSFNGNSTGNNPTLFRIREWEVWRVIFDSSINGQA